MRVENKEMTKTQNQTHNDEDEHGAETNNGETEGEQDWTTKDEEEEWPDMNVQEDLDNSYTVTMGFADEDWESTKRTLQDVQQDEEQRKELFEREVRTKPPLTKWQKEGIEREKPACESTKITNIK